MNTKTFLTLICIMAGTTIFGQNVSMQNIEQDFTETVIEKYELGGMTLEFVKNIQGDFSVGYDSLNKCRLIIDEYAPDTLQFARAYMQEMINTHGSEMKVTMDMNNVECIAQLNDVSYIVIQIDSVRKFTASYQYSVPIANIFMEYPCIEGMMKIDKPFWEKGILKATFRFVFLYIKHPQIRYKAEPKQFIFSGKILTNIGNFAR